MTTRGNGGNWNRAGRMNGGARPVDLTPAPEVACTCGRTTPFGLLTQYLLQGAVSVKCCPGCRGVLFALIDGEWIRADRLLADSAPPVSQPGGHGEGG